MSVGGAGEHRRLHVAPLLGIPLERLDHGRPGRPQPTLPDVGGLLHAVRGEVGVEHDHLGAVAVKVLFGDAPVVSDPGIVEAPRIDGPPARVERQQAGLGGGEGVTPGAEGPEPQGHVVEADPPGLDAGRVALLDCDDAERDGYDRRRERRPEHPAPPSQTA